MGKKKYLIPRAPRARTEIFPGFGVPECVAVGGGFITGFIIQHLLSLLPPNKMISFAKIVILILFTAVPYFFVKPNVYGNTLWKQVRDYRNWRQSQRRYLYQKPGTFKKLAL